MGLLLFFCLFLTGIMGAHGQILINPYKLSHGTNPTLSIDFSPPDPSAAANASGGTVVVAIVTSWSNGHPFVGTLAFGPPYFDDGGIFAIDGSNNLIVSSSGPGLAGDANTTQNVTIVATQ